MRTKPISPDEMDVLIEGEPFRPFRVMVEHVEGNRPPDRRRRRK